MTTLQIEEMLIDEIVAILKLNGCYESPVTRDVRPLEDLGGFDSLNAFEVVVSMSEKVGFDIEASSFGIDCSKQNPNLLTIEEIAKVIAKLNKKKG